MALRRPPTRIELKTDDIEEYEEVNIQDRSEEKERQQWLFCTQQQVQSVLTRSFRSFCSKHQ
jgi:hypothetical protein